MKARDIGFVATGTLVAATCIRLGMWQLDRLSERRVFNSQLSSRAEMPPVDISLLPPDTGSSHYRRVRIGGVYDFDREIVLASRSRDGSPGVNIITPLRRPGSDTAVLINRGWVYSPDGMSVDLERWREASPMSGSAYVEHFSSRKGEVKSARHPRAHRWLDRAALSATFPYPIVPYYLVLIDSGATNPDIPPRIPVPRLDEGPHRSYAFQWFSFAAISIIGMILYLRRK